MKTQKEIEEKLKEINREIEEMKENEKEWILVESYRTLEQSKLALEWILN